MQETLIIHVSNCLTRHCMAVDVEKAKVNELALTMKIPITIYQTLKHFQSIKVLVQFTMPA